MGFANRLVRKPRPLPSQDAPLSFIPTPSFRVLDEGRGSFDLLLCHLSPSACQVVVGTPGRLCALVESGRLLLSTMQLVVLDEADQLLGDSFREDIEWLHEQLVTDGVQVLPSSALPS